MNCYSKIDNPWSCLTSFSNSVPLTRLGSITINGSQFDYRYESNQVAIRRPGQQWREPIAIEWLGEEGEEIRVRVMDEIVRSVVRKENESVHLFPVSNTDHFSSVHYDVFESISQPVPSDKTSAQSASVSTVVSPMPGSVSRVLVKNGEKVKKGDIVVVIEAMKMEVDLVSCSYIAFDYGSFRRRSIDGGINRAPVPKERPINFPGSLSYFLTNSIKKNNKTLQ